MDKDEGLCCCFLFLQCNDTLWISVLNHLERKSSLGVFLLLVKYGFESVLQTAHRSRCLHAGTCFSVD